MELNEIYIKTAKGQEEIQRRIYKLSANLRKVLIMVDGRSTATEMAERLIAMGNITLALTELEAGGFITSLSLARQSSILTSTVKPPLPSEPTENPQSERMLLESIWETDDRPATSTKSLSSIVSGGSLPGQPAFNLDKAKGFIRSILLSALGPSAERRIERVQAARSVEDLRVELDAIHELLPKVLPKHQAEQVWKQLEPIMQPFAPQSSQIASPAQPHFNMDKAKGLIRFILLGALGPSAAHRIERVEAAITVEALRFELQAIHEMLPKVLPKRQAEHAWKQLEPIILAIVLPPS